MDAVGVARREHQYLFAPPQMHQRHRPAAVNARSEVVVVPTGADVQQVQGSRVCVPTGQHTQAGDAAALPGHHADIVAEHAEQQVQRRVVTAGQPQRRGTRSSRPGADLAVVGDSQPAALMPGDHAGVPQPQVRAGNSAGAQPCSLRGRVRTG